MPRPNPAFDPQSILDDDERVPVQFLVPAYRLGSLDESSGNRDIEEAQTLELPLWLAEPLAQRRFVLVSLPRNYSSKVRESLVADASVVRLREKSPAFYETGLRLARISGDEDAARLPAAIQATLATRVANILSRSQHSLSADVSEYKNGLTNLEQALFEGGFEYVRDRLAWKKRQSTTIRAGDARVGGVEGSLEIGAASRGTKRPRRSAVG